MVVTKKLTLDLARKTILGTVDAVRGDSAIALELTLLCDGAPWVIPADASVMLRYCQGDAGGEYDTLPDGTAAWQISGNVLTVRLAPQVCSAAGKTDFQVAVFQGTNQISTFRMVVEVEPEVSGSDQPEAYTNLAQWLKENAGGLSRTEIQTMIDLSISAIAVYNGEVEDV